MAIANQLGLKAAYLHEESKVNYESKESKEERVFGALEWLLAMSSHVPRLNMFH